MPTVLLTIARNTFIEAVRQPIYLLLIALALFAMLFTTWSTGFSMGYSDSAEVSGDDKMLLDVGLATIFLAGTLMAAFIASSAVSREVENKTVLTVVSKPVPRTLVILGKYVGVSAAILIGSIAMLAALLLAVRHGVLTAVADKSHVPVIVFSLSAILLSTVLATIFNFLYGWNFCQSCSLLLCPALVLAYFAALNFSREFELQPINTIALKPQVTIAGGCLVLGVLVITSIAIAASSRLGQVLTILCCMGVLVLGLLSTTIVGRHAFINQHSGIVRSVTITPNTAAARDDFVIALKGTARPPFAVGDTIYYGPNPNGFDLASGNSHVPMASAADAASGEPTQLYSEGLPSTLLVTAVGENGSRLTVKNVGDRPLSIRRAPQRDDYVFRQPTSLNIPVLAAWGILPNLQFFWLLDAVTQNSPIGLGHVLLVVAYAAAQVTVYLSLAIALFQRRDVG